jgi:signal peptidase
MRNVARNTVRLAGVAVVVGWLLLLRPAGLGGPATYVIVSGDSMLPNLKGSDLVVTHGHDTYKPGDVVAFRVNGQHVIHRIVGGNGTDGYETRGDNNAASDPWRPTNADIAGESRYVVPGGGRPIGLLRQDPLLLACLGGGLALFLTLSRRGKAENPPRHLDRPAEVFAP